jgi:hypothetical protein
LLLLKNCKTCNREYVAVSSRKYCSKDCYVKAHTKTFVCEVCGSEFARYVHKSTTYKACGKVCGGKIAYSKHDGLTRPETLEKSRLACKNNKPSIQGGNGRGTTVPQDILLSALVNGWEAEYIVTLGSYKTTGYPNHYKIDIANPKLKIAVEVDGGSHNTFLRQAQDKKKEEKLIEMGWTVLRFKNREVIENHFKCLDEICLIV